MNSFINQYKITFKKLQMLFKGKNENDQKDFLFCQDLMKRTVFLAFYLTIVSQRSPSRTIEREVTSIMNPLFSLNDLAPFKRIADIYFPLELKIIESLEKKEEEIINNVLKKFIESFSWELSQNLNNKSKKNSVTPEIFELIYHSENPKKHGVVFTPYPFAYWMVQSCFQRHLARFLNSPNFSMNDLDLLKRDKKRRLNNIILKIRALDISVGCGTLYLAAFNYLLTLNNRLGLLDGNSYLVLKRICLYNLYGVDIDENALVMCKVRLILQIFEKAPSIQVEDLLELIDNVNLKTGNFLIGFIADPRIHRMVDYNQLLIYGINDNEINNPIFLNNQNIFHWFLEFPKIFNKSKTSGFDIIFGNPPYIGYRFIDKTVKRTLKHLYSKIYTGLNDYYYYFIWRAKQLLAPNGSSVLVVTRYFLEARYAEKLRSELIGSGYVDAIIDFRDFKIFSKGINTAVLFLTKNSAYNHQSQILVLKNHNLSPRTLLQELQASIKNLSLKSSRIFQHFTISRTETLNSKFLFASKTLRNLIKRIESQCVPLEQVCNIGTGYHSGKDKVFSPSIIKQNGEINALIENKGIIDRFPLETEIVEEIVKTPNILPYIIIGDRKYVILTKRGINIDEFPFTKQYLEHFKEILTSRYEVRKNLAKWYEIAQVRNLHLFKAKLKIMCPYRARVPRFAIDKRQRYSSIDCTSIAMKKSLNIYYILGVLNSELIEFYLYIVAKKIDAQKIELYPKTISNIPIKVPTTKEENFLVKKITEHTKNICNLLESSKFTPKQHQQLLKYGRRGFFKINDNIQGIIKTIDMYVYQLYGLDDQIETLKNEFTHPYIENLGDAKNI